MAPPGSAEDYRAREGGDFCAAVSYFGSRYHTCTCNEGGLAAKRSDGLQTIIIYYSSIYAYSLKAIVRLITSLGPPLLSPGFYLWLCSVHHLCSSASSLLSVSCHLLSQPPLTPTPTHPLSPSRLHLVSATFLWLPLSSG